ncbi:MAG: SusC/RagA family TonB-linked outer membrane protein [Ferruginibacter sp.]
MLATIKKSAMLLLAVFGFTVMALAQTQTVTGTVTDKKGEPIPGVTVSIKGSKTATSTNAQGVYTLTNVPSDAVLVFTGVGVTSREENVNGKSSLNVDVETSVGNLNEVIVVGYGTARKRDLTGSVASVKAKDFNKGLVTGADQLIQGKVAGVQIINTSGAPGGATTVRIRGNSSVRSGNQPLFVIDGVPLDGRSARPGVDINLTDAPGRTPDANPLNFINPNDIASMDVLKDASATAIYGSRGANGVVLITTKKGLSGASKIDFSASAGVSNLFRNYKVLDASQYRAALKEYGLTSGDFGGNVDAMDEITRTAISQNYNIAIGGGNESGKYRLSAGYQNLEGIIKKSGFKKYTANLNTNFKFLESKKLGLDINVLTSQTTENIAPIANTSGFTGSLISQAISWNPTHPLRNPDGTIWIKDAAIGQTTINPLTTLEAYSDVSNLTGVLASVSPYYKFNNDLEYRFLYSVNHSVGTRRTSLKSYINIQSIEGKGWANYGNNELTTQLAQHTLNYNKKISSSLNLNAVVGYEYQKFDSKGTGQSGQGFLTTDVDYTNYLQGSTQDSRRSTSFADPISELQSFFGRVAFNLEDKYLLTATMRADGSSKFGTNNRYGYFPSVAGAWNISNEDFMKDGLFDNFKLRVGWGKTGNQEFPAGSAQERYSFSQGSYQQSNVANPDLKWETSTTTNAGIDFGLFKGRLSGTVDYFNKQTSDLLFNFDAIQPAPATKYWVNLGGDVINKGWEVALNALIVKSRDLNWNLGVNAAFLQNELQNYVGPAVLTGELSGQGISGTRVQKLENGYPLNSFYVRRFLGLDKSSGISTYTDNGNSFFYIGNPNPSTLLGISTDVTYKNLSLSVNLNGAFGHEIYNNTLNSVLNIGNLGSRNIAASLLEGDIQENKSNGLAASSRYLENGNYLKVANATLSYGVGNIGRSIKNLNIFITGQNLAVITKFTGFDPEVNTDKQIDGVPSFGIEYIPYPSPRTFLLGVTFSL